MDDLTAGPNAGALRDCERQVAAARHHVQARVADLEDTAATLEADASRSLNQQWFGNAAGHLLDLERTRIALYELRRVLDLL